MKIIFAKLFETPDRQILVTNEGQNEDGRFCIKITTQSNSAIASASFSHLNEAKVKEFFNEIDTETAESFVKELGIISLIDSL